MTSAKTADPLPASPPAVRQTKRGFAYGQWRERDIVVASAKPFDTVTAWRKAAPGAYNSARENGWQEEACGHMKRRNEWTETLLQADARNYSHPAEWKKANASAYATAVANNWLQQCCTHMTHLRKPDHYWTREKCIESAKGFQTIVEWTQRDGGAVDAAFRNGWYKEAITHMIEIVSFGEYTIRRLLMSYDIAFECEKQYEELRVKRLLRYDFFLPCYGLLIEYHGEQHFVEREHYHGRWTLEQIQAYDKRKLEYAIQNEIPLLTVSVSDVAEIEAQVVAKLNQIIDSRPHMPSLGTRRLLTEADLVHLATAGIWTFERVCEDALQYQRYSDWTGTYSYQLAIKRGWLAQVSAHMERTHRERGYWTSETLAEDARQYTSRKAWQKAPGSGYGAANARKIVEQVAPHLTPLRKTWTLADCQASAKPFESRKEWSDNAPSAYMAALRAGWSDECCRHMTWRSKKPQEKYAAIAKPAKRTDIVKK